MSCNMRLHGLIAKEGATFHGRGPTDCFVLSCRVSSPGAGLRHVYESMYAISFCALVPILLIHGYLENSMCNPYRSNAARKSRLPH